MSNKRVLRHSHPLSKKLEQVFDLMNQLGLTFEQVGDRTIVTDIEFSRIQFDIEDSETCHSIETIPPQLEYKVTYTPTDEQLREEAMMFLRKSE